MTVHSAKGLEFRSVFLTGMEEEIFPYSRVSHEEPEEIDFSSRSVSAKNGAGEQGSANRPKA